MLSSAAGRVALILIAAGGREIRLDDVAGHMSQSLLRRVDALARADLPAAGMRQPGFILALTKTAAGWMLAPISSRLFRDLSLISSRDVPRNIERFSARFARTRRGIIPEADPPCSIGRRIIMRSGSVKKRTGSSCGANSATCLRKHRPKPRNN